MVVRSGPGHKIGVGIYLVVDEGPVGPGAGNRLTGRVEWVILSQLKNQLLSNCKDGGGCHTSLYVRRIPVCTFVHTRLRIRCLYAMPLNTVGQITRYLVDFNRPPFYAESINGTTNNPQEKHHDLQLS